MMEGYVSEFFASSRCLYVGRGSGLEIVLLLTGRSCSPGSRPGWRADHGQDRRQRREIDALVSSEASKHRHALASVITWASLVIIYCVTGLQILPGWVSP